MPNMWHPATQQNVFVPDILVNSKKKQGYTTRRFEANPLLVLPEPTQASALIPTLDEEVQEKIPVNYATSKDFESIGIPLAIAKQIVKNVPYPSFEELQNKITGFGFAGLENAFSFDMPT